MRSILPGSTDRSLIPSDRRFILMKASIRRDGRLLAVGSDGGVLFWDLASGRELPEPGDRICPASDVRGIRRPADHRFIGLWRWPVSSTSTRTYSESAHRASLTFPREGLGLDEDRSGKIVALAHDNALDVPIVRNGCCRLDRWTTAGPSQLALTGDGSRLGAI